MQNSLNSGNRANDKFVELFSETLSILEVGGYKDSLGRWHDIPTKFPGQRFYPTLKPTKNKKGISLSLPPKIYAQKIDTFQKAKSMGPGSVVLNMASSFKPGGGVINGAKSQEEDLCRRSNLYFSLSHFIERYPLPKFGGIYTPDVTIFRAPSSYNLLRKPYKCSVISFSAIRKPELIEKNFKKYIITLKGKIRGILRIAVLSKKSKLVLGAFGCGAYQNPPTLVAEAFRDVLNEDEFQKRFSEICFAILPDNRTGDKNFNEFSKIFNTISYS